MRALMLMLAVGASTGLHAAALTEPHPAMPMLAEPADPDTNKADQLKLRDDFAKSYQRESSPRIAVWFNRELSDRVEEWVTPVRARGALINDKGEVRDIEASVQFRDGNDTSRDLPGEDWAWAFEDGFDRPFLDQGVRLVDRNMIVRIVGASNGGDPDKTVALKKLEIDALRGHADLMVELLIKRAPGSKSGYNYRAKVVNVNTGRVLAMVNAPDLAPVAGGFEATDKGYERKGLNGAPAVQEVAGLLADEVMQRLLKVWK